jgi:hypothetical protein
MGLCAQRVRALGPQDAAPRAALLGHHLLCCCFKNRGLLLRRVAAAAADAAKADADAQLALPREQPAERRKSWALRRRRRNASSS